jgi:rubrerythrin
MGNTSVTFDRLRIMDICCQIEEHCSELYQFFAQIHSDDREVARIWCLTAVDEDNHVNLFKMASRLKGEGIIDLFVTVEMATEMLNNIKTLLKNVRNKPPSKLTALRFTIKMEKNLSQIHLGYIANFSNDHIKNLFSSTLKRNQERIRQLERIIIEKSAKPVETERPGSIGDCVP